MWSLFDVITMLGKNERKRLARLVAMHKSLHKGAVTRWKSPTQMSWHWRAGWLALDKQQLSVLVLSCPYWRVIDPRETIHFLMWFHWIWWETKSKVLMSELSWCHCNLIKYKWISSKVLLSLKVLLCGAANNRLQLQQLIVLFLWYCFMTNCCCWWWGGIFMLKLELTFWHYFLLWERGQQCTSHDFHSPLRGSER